ncbi:MAG TPA: tetratricopeptide repeat protein [Thermoanaerobaculia bacterium]|nr:tetratricopeptide repeat protein [Thermoanaerobaculia bacterium]
MIQPGGRIGHIRIESHLAEGGMGAVYVGFDEKLERPVALKAIRSDRLDARSRSRFLVEARLLSQLDHPNICRIHGYQEDPGGDFLVLELIRGRTLRQALKEGIDPAARLAVAEAIARALEAAHEKGIVHRDLKLDNVMVTEDGTAKVLDFGLARSEAEGAWEENAAEESGPVSAAELPHPPPAGASWWMPSQGAGTELGALVGTPANMSPEQARGKPATAASDAYALGLLLQELFTGRPPYEAGLSPSLLLVKAADGDTLPVGKIRDPDLAALIRRLKALAPEARPTLAEAAARLAWTRGKPSRLRWRLLAAALAVLLVLGVIKYTLDLRRERQLAVEARNAAQQEAVRADAVARFLEDLFQASNPRQARGDLPDARELLRRGTERLGKDLQDQPLLRAQLLDTLGGIHTDLGLFEEARPLLEEALAIRERLHGREHLEVAETLARLGALARLSGKGDAVPPLRRALAIREARLGRDSPEVADLLNALGTTLATQGHSGEAELLLRRSLALRERLWGDRDPRVAQVLHNLSGLALQRARIDEARQLLRRALAIREAALPEDDPDLTGSREALALVLIARKDTEAEGVRLLERVAADREKVYGPEHPELARTLLNLGLTLSDLGDAATARRHLERSLAIDERTLEPGHPVLLKTLSLLAEHDRRHGHTAAARALDLRVLDITGSRLAAEPENLVLLAARARALLGLGRTGDARPLVKSLRDRGWKDAAFETLCRRHGL